jgi:dTDP-4-dehydrorhamnose 3,5-epimerase
MNMLRIEPAAHLLPGARKDAPLITREWQLLRRPIDGVHVHEVRHVPRDHGVITEMFRPEWDPSGLPVVQVYQSRLFPGAIGAWSCHAHTVDRLFVSDGQLKIVLYDAREGSATRGTLLELHSGTARPALLVVPPGVWHGVQNLGPTDAILVNCPTAAYNYEDPDHYRLPYDSPEIPYRWNVASGARLRTDAR